MGCGGSCGCDGDCGDAGRAADRCSPPETIVPPDATERSRRCSTASRSPSDAPGARVAAPDVGEMMETASGATAVVVSVRHFGMTEAIGSPPRSQSSVAVVPELAATLGLVRGKGSPGFALADIDSPSGKLCLCECRCLPLPPEYCTPQPEGGGGPGCGEAMPLPNAELPPPGSGSASLEPPVTDTHAAHASGSPRKRVTTRNHDAVRPSGSAWSARVRAPFRSIASSTPVGVGGRELRVGDARRDSASSPLHSSVVGDRFSAASVIGQYRSRTTHPIVTLPTALSVPNPRWRREMGGRRGWSGG